MGMDTSSTPIIGTHSLVAMSSTPTPSLYVHDLNTKETMKKIPQFNKKNYKVEENIDAVVVSNEADQQCFQSANLKSSCVDAPEPPAENEQSCTKKKKFDIQTNINQTFQQSKKKNEEQEHFSFNNLSKQQA